MKKQRNEKPIDEELLMQMMAGEAAGTEEPGTGKEETAVPVEKAQEGKTAETRRRKGRQADYETTFLKGMDIPARYGKPVYVRREYIEMKDFLENGDTTDFSHTRMNIYFRELGNESPLLVKLIMQSIYKEDRREIRHLGCKRFGVQFLLKSVHSHNGLFYFHTETRNRSNVAFWTDFIRFKIVDKKVPKRTAIQERVIDPVRSYNEVLVTEGKSDVRTVYAVPQFTIPDDKLLVIELFEKDGGRHQTIRVENADLVAAKQINELKIK